MIGLIPAAGSGTRMMPFTRAMPKELFHIQRKAVIDHAIETLHDQAGVDKIFVVVGSHKGAIIDHVGDGSMHNSGKLKIAYVFQEERKGLAHAIYQGKGFINENFMVHAGDSFIHPKSEIKEAIQTFNKENPFALVLAKEISDPTKYGILKVDDRGYLVDAIEKPTIKQAENFKTNNGKYLCVSPIYIFKKEIFDYIEKTPAGAKNEYQITDSIMLALRDKKKIRVHQLKGEAFDIGNWEDAEKSEEILKK
ncbi:MAG: sugar phosphate nucleotidyltransferase [Candidatus Nanoarchaeia archaeon]|nr:sugar phosphate nucleotidyltransferase [Candidatus Nanoarchaeia archaeon]